MRRIFICILFALLLTGCEHFRDFSDKMQAASAKKAPPPLEMGDETDAQIIFEPAKAPEEAAHHRASRQFSEDLNRFLVWLKIGEGRTFQVPEKPVEPDPFARGAKRVQLRRFTEVAADGPFDLTIKPTSGRQRVLIKGPKETLRYLLAKIEDSRLILSIKTDEYIPENAAVTVETNVLDYLVFAGPGNLKVSDIDARNLELDLATSGEVAIEGSKIGVKRMRLHGKGKIKVAGISSKELSVETIGDDQVSLTGMACLQKLAFGGHSKLSFYWLDTPELQIVGSGDGFVKLAGYTGILEAELYNHATLDAKYLRAKRSYVKAFNASTAHLRTIREQNALALNNSNIYYYNMPPLNAPHMGDTGSVFDNLALNRH